ncbi:hypothetical protein GALL_36840 [mine drainage metagenome]|uniref:Uncharacterized protein n=1 Tax=mine drainage metagenome TaxID=410659 RepID=A0A1J5T3B4_9ZZZZ
MLTGAMLGLMEKIALDIMILTGEIGEEEFFASRITRAQTLQLLHSLIKTAASLPVGTRERMPQIDWAALEALKIALAKPSQHPLRIWVAIRELTPMTVQQLNGYKKAQPQLFSMVP